MKSLRASLDEWTDAEQKRRAESKPGVETKTALCTVLLGRFGMDVEQCDAQEKEAKASSVLSTSLTFGGAEDTIDCADKEAALKNEKVCMPNAPPRLAGRSRRSRRRKVPRCFSSSSAATTQGENPRAYG